MKLKAAVAIGAVAVLTMPVAAGAAPGTGSKVTGGGQSLTDGKDTIGFNARAVAGAAHAGDGQVQFVDRAATGSTQTQYHGDVTCYLQVGNNAAVIAGTWRNVNGDPADTTGFFRLYVQDNGEPNRGRDFIFMNTSAPDATCEESDEDDDHQSALAHGNVQFHPAKGTRAKKSKKQGPAKAAPKVDLGTSLKLARL